MFNIRIAEHCGLCAGARRSIDIALAALREGEASGRPVVLFRELLHNETVMERLRALGALRTDALADIPPGALVVVRAHGEGKAFHDQLRAAGHELRDGTCPNVKKVHELVRLGHAGGKAVAIFGKRGHPEVEGTKGWCGGAAVVLENEADVEAMATPEEETILAVCQTTAGKETAARLLDALLRRFPEKAVAFEDTICPAPLRILEPSARLAGECDTLFTIGGAKSANTGELRSRCARVGVAECPPQMEGSGQLLAYLKANTAAITPEKRYGFTAGASTPVEEVARCRDLLTFRLYYGETKKRLEAKMTRVNEAFAAGGAGAGEGGGNGVGGRILREAGERFAAINGGGKYLRGVLANLGHRIATGGDGAAEHPDPLSLAFEVFQTAVLIHDDLIDHAALRRGRTTIHHRYREAYLASASRDGFTDAGGADTLRLARETADGLAVCIGDWGMFRAAELLAEAYGAEPRFAELLRLFNAMIIKTVQGEIIDVALPFERRTGISREAGEPLLAAIRAIHHRKTSWYTTIGPMLCGMILGGGGEGEMAAMREFADNLGLAYQIQDDLLGVFGSADALGKDVGSDVAEYKQTLLYAFTEAFSPELFEELRLYYGKENPGAADHERVKQIFIESGAREKTVAEMHRCFDRAREALERANFLSGENRSLLNGLLLSLAPREN